MLAAINVCVFCKTDQFTAINVRGFLSRGLTLCQTLLHKNGNNSLHNGPILKIQLGPESREQGLQILACYSFVKIAKFVNNNRARKAIPPTLINFCIHLIFEKLNAWEI